MKHTKVKFRQWLCNVDLQEYKKGGFALGLFHVEYGDPVATATAWVPDLKQDEIALRTYECDGIDLILIEAGVIEKPHRSIESGYVTMPVAYLTKEFLANNKPQK